MRISERNVTQCTHIVLSVTYYVYRRYALNRKQFHIKHKVNLIQLKTYELELDFAEYYIHHIDVRIADLCWVPYIQFTE